MLLSMLPTAQTNETALFIPSIPQFRMYRAEIHTWTNLQGPLTTSQCHSSVSKLSAQAIERVRF